MTLLCDISVLILHSPFSFEKKRGKGAQEKGCNLTGKSVSELWVWVSDQNVGNVCNNPLCNLLHWACINYWGPKQAQKSEQDEVQSITSKVKKELLHTLRATFRLWGLKKRIDKRNEAEWVTKADIRKVEFLAVVKACKATFKPTLELKDRIFDRFGD